MFIATKLRNFFRLGQKTRSKNLVYQVAVNPNLDENMGKLAARLGKDRTYVFQRAMHLYIELKNRQLDREMDHNSLPFHVLSDDRKSEEIKFTDV